MIRIHRRQALGSLLALIAGLHPRAAGSQAIYPTRPIRVIVPFAAGGVGDTVIRVLAPIIEKKLSQKLIVESKPGGLGNIGAQEVARATADGYTLLVATANNFVINPALMKMTFDPLTTVPPIAKVADIPLIFCSNPSVPVHDLPGFIQYARAHPGELNYGSPGNGSNNHLLVEKLNQLTGIELVHVPYRGAPQGAMATLTNEVQLYPMGFAVVGGHLQAGKLTALAVPQANGYRCYRRRRQWSKRVFPTSSARTGGRSLRRKVRQNRSFGFSMAPLSKPWVILLWPNSSLHWV